MKYSKEFKIGLFAVVVLVVSYFLINYLRGEDIFDNEIEVCSSYGNVEGLVASAPVYIKGYKAGKVTEVAYDSETGDFNVTCSVSKEFRIPEDSKMTIYSVDIMGGKGVRIDLGCSEMSAEDGSYLSPSFEAGLMDGLASGVVPLLAKVTSTLDSLSVTVSGVNSVLSQENRSNIAGTLAHLESDELAAFIDNLSSVSSKLEGVAERADTVMAGVSSVVGSLSESDIDGIVSSFNLLLQNINDPEGTVGKLLVDKSVYDSVDGLLNDIDSLVRKIEENPKKYIRISVF